MGIIEDVDSLRELVGLLSKELEAFKLENAALKQEIAALRSRLGLNSRNSHKPPSSDGFKKKTVAQALPKDKTKKNGGQRGHKGKTLEMVKTPDKLEIHIPSACECCGRNFDSHEVCSVSLQSRQVFDIPEPKIVVTDHRLGEVFCCGRVQKGQFPDSVSAPVQYGHRIKALSTLLNVEYRIPLQKSSQLIEDLYGVAINQSSLLEFQQIAGNVSGQRSGQRCNQGY